MFAVFRMGTHIPVPGVDPSAIERLFNSGTLFGLLDLFSGGALSKFSIFAMSITPYINASIIIQLLNVVIPTLEQWSKEGEEGHKKTTKVTRYFTVALAFLQAMGMSIGLKEAVLNPGPASTLIIAITLTAGTVFLMWVGEQITANGVGNGISLIIFAGIVAALPSNIGKIYHYLQAGTISYINVFLFAAIAVAMIVFVIILLDGKSKKSFVAIGSLAVTFSAGMAISLSPTLLASSDRPLLFLYFVIIFNCAILADDIIGFNKSKDSLNPVEEISK